MWNFQGSSFLGSEFPRDLTQLYGISRGGALFCLEFPGLKEKNEKFQGFSKKYTLNPPPPPYPRRFFFWYKTIPDVTANDWQYFCLTKYRELLLDYLGKKIPMSRITRFSEKPFFKKTKSEMGSNAIALNFSNELDSTDCSMQVLERLDF